MEKIKVAYICVHNSCRSQIAEALSKKYANDVFESYSAGTMENDKLNPDALRLMKDIYDIDMEKNQYSKLIEDIPEVDIVITMGCNVSCPHVKSKYKEDWGLEDPTGKSDDFFRETIIEIERKVINLRQRYLEDEII